MDENIKIELMEITERLAGLGYVTLMIFTKNESNESDIVISNLERSQLVDFLKEKLDRI